MQPCIEHHQAPGRAVYGYKVWAGKVRLMHRLAYVNAHGLTLDDIHGKVVRHTCDNPRCINPDHLLIGTHSDNMKDMWSRGRGVNLPPRRAGEAHPGAKLNEATVAAIRAHPGPIRRAAKEFGMSYGQTQRIRAGEAWR